MNLKTPVEWNINKK